MNYSNNNNNNNNSLGGSAFNGLTVELVRNLNSPNCPELFCYANLWCCHRAYMIACTGDHE